MSSGEEYFRANKHTRTETFNFPQTNDTGPEASGDQGSSLHPVPAVLGNSQKVGKNPTGEMSPESAADERAGRS